MTIYQSPKIIIIVGPTSSGKSDLGIKIAKRIHGEIISADSRQVYRGMDIGTGKATKDMHKAQGLKSRAGDNSGLSPLALDFKRYYYSSGIRHHLIDVASPKKQFNASDFKKLGEKAIREILAKSKIPIIVGGTGFYIDVLLGRRIIAQIPPNKKLRAQFDKLTAEKLFEKLVKLDPERAKNIDRNNKRRLVRALEIVITTGQPVPSSRSKASGTSGSLASVLWLGVNPGKDRLAKNIKRRLDARLRQGMIKEVVKLHKQGISWKRLDDLGLEYRWISRWLKNSNFQFSIFNQFSNLNFQKSDEYKNLLRDIVRYSKRQMTWFKRNKEIHWIKNRKEAEKLAEHFVS